MTHGILFARLNEYIVSINVNMTRSKRYEVSYNRKLLNKPYYMKILMCSEIIPNNTIIYTHAHTHPCKSFIKHRLEGHTLKW